MTRLTNEIRTRIVAKAVEKAGFEKREAELRAKYEALAEDVRVFSLGGVDEVKRLERLKTQVESLMALAPKDLIHYEPFRTDSVIRINVQGMRSRLVFSEGPDRLCAGDYIVIPPEHDLAKRWVTLERLSKDCERERRELERSVGAVLNSVTTIKRLLEVWPVAKELLPENLEGPTTGTSLQVNLATLNEKLGLGDT